MIDCFNNKISVGMRHFLKYGPWLLLGDGVQQVTGIALTLLIARIATQETLGQFQLVLSIIAMVAIVSIRGIDTVVLRDAARNIDGVYKRAIKTRFFWSLLSVPAMIVVAVYYRYADNDLLALVFSMLAFLMPFHYVFQSWQSLYKGKGLFRLYAYSSMARSLLTLLLVSLALVFSGGDIVIVLLVYLSVHIFINGVTVLRSRYVVKNDEISSDWKGYSYFLSKAGFFKQIVANIDKVLVGFIFSPAVLAVYAIAIIIPNALMLSFKSLFTMVLPKLSNRNFLKFKDLLVALVVGIIGTGIAMLMVIILLVPLFGKQYEAALPMALVASGALLFLPLSQLLVSFASMQGKRKAVLANQLFSPTLKLILIITLGSMWQVMGFVVVFALVPLIWSVFALFTLKIDFQKMIIT